VHDQGGYNAKIKRWNVVFWVDPTSSVYLAWQGRNEYQKWKLIATGHSSLRRAKYDIYAVLAQNGSDLTWGSPTQGPIKLETFSLKDVQSIRLLVDDKPVPMEMPRVKVVPSP